MAPRGFRSGYKIYLFYLFFVRFPFFTWAQLMLDLLAFNSSINNVRGICNYSTIYRYQESTTETEFGDTSVKN